MSESWASALTWVWFALTYLGLALGQFPGLRIDRTGIALVGAALVLATGLLTFKEAIASIDFATLALLLGMMIVVAYLRQARFFAYLAGRALARIDHPRVLLAVVMGLSGLLSAFLVNDVVCVALTPLVLKIARDLRLDPKPHLLGLALAANIGSTATLTGNPQNMIIGGLSQIPYLRFAARLAPVAALGLGLAFVVLLVCYRVGLRSGERHPAPVSTAPPLRRRHRRLLVKSVLVTAAAVVLFFCNVDLPIVALGAAAALLLERVKPAKIYGHVDWGLLVMFAGLFVVVHAFDVHVVRGWHVEKWAFLQASPIVLLSLVSAALSNLVSNVPAVLLFEPVLPALPDSVRETAWLALAMSSTLAGNLTVLGSVANLIVVEKARQEGVALSFWDYSRVGIPVTILTLALGIAWLALVPY